MEHDDKRSPYTIREIERALESMDE